MTLSEYQLRMEAYGLKRIEYDRRAMMTAFFTQVAKSTTGSIDNPRPKYEHFTDLFDEQAEIDRVRGTYEDDYKPEKVQKPDINAIVRERVKKFHELKKKGLIAPIDKKKGGEK